jgi:hypothetical protein
MMSTQDTGFYNQKDGEQQSKLNHCYTNKEYFNILNDYNFSKDFNNILASVEWMSKKEIPEADEEAWYFLYDLILSAKKIKDQRCVVACHELANRMKKTSGSSQMRTAILENSILSIQDCVEVIECSLENGSYETAIYNITEFIKQEQNFFIAFKVLSAIDSSAYEIEISTKSDIAKRFINTADRLLLKDIAIKKECGLFGKYYSLSWESLHSSDVKKYLKLRKKYNPDKLHIEKAPSPRQIEKQKQKAENKANCIAQNSSNDVYCTNQKSSQAQTNNTITKGKILNDEDYINKVVLDKEISADMFGGSYTFKLKNIDVYKVEKKKYHYGIKAAICSSEKSTSVINNEYKVVICDYKRKKILCETSKFNIHSSDFDAYHVKLNKLLDLDFTFGQLDKLLIKITMNRTDYLLYYSVPDHKFVKV